MASAQPALPLNKQMASSCTSGGLDWILEKFSDFSCKSHSRFLSFLTHVLPMLWEDCAGEGQPALGTDTAPLAPCTDHLLKMQAYRGAVILLLTETPAFQKSSLLAEAAWHEVQGTLLF